MGVRARPLHFNGREMPDWLGQAAIGLVTAIVTAIATVRLSARQFRSQHWWERKVEAYSDIIEALHGMHRFDAEAFDAAIEGRELSQEYHDRLLQEWRAGHERLKKAEAYGALIIHPDAYAALKKLRIEMARASDPNSSWDEHLDLESAAIGNCLNEIRRIAARDLDVEQPGDLVVVQKSS
jgi:hypothetical protein